MSGKARPIQVYLEADVRGRLEQLRRRTGRSLSEEVRRAIVRHLDSRPVVSSSPLPDDDAGAADDYRVVRDED